MIKKILKKLFPVTIDRWDHSTQQFKKELFDISETLNGITEVLENTGINLKDTSAKIEDLKIKTAAIDETARNEYLQTCAEFKVLKEKADENKKLENAVLHNMHRKRFYNNDHEKAVIKSFHDYYDAPNYKELFLRLIHGLNEEDVATVVRILKRQQDIRDNDGKAIDIYTEDEQKQIGRMMEHFKKEIFRVSDDLYCYHNYLLPTDHFEASVLYYKHGIENIENIDYTLDKDIIDAGGYIGDSILILSPLTTKKVYSFEAVSKNFETMKKTILLNNIKNAVPVNLALGSENGEIEMNVSGTYSTSQELSSDILEYKETAQMVTLDSYVEKHGLTVGLIKVDIEGAEQDFLKGAKNTIERDKPILLLSIYHNANDFFNIKPIIEDWNLGYSFKIYKPVDFSISREVLLIAEVR